METKVRSVANSFQELLHSRHFVTVVVEGHYFLPAWKLRQDFENGEGAWHRKWKYASNFCSHRAGQPREGGESHIEPIFPLELAQGRVKLGDFFRGPSNSRNISCLHSRNLVGSFERPPALRVCIAWGHFRPRLNGGCCCFQNAMTTPLLQIAPAGQLALSPAPARSFSNAPMRGHCRLSTVQPVPPSSTQHLHVS